MENINYQAANKCQIQIHEESAPVKFRVVPSPVKKYKYNQLAIVEFNNCGPYIERFVSNKPITIDKVAKYLEKRDYFDEWHDSLTFIDEPTETVLETVLK